MGKYIDSTKPNYSTTQQQQQSNSVYHQKTREENITRHSLGSNTRRPIICIQNIPRPTTGSSGPKTNHLSKSSRFRVTPPPSQILSYANHSGNTIDLPSKWTSRQPLSIGPRTLLIHPTKQNLRSFTALFVHI